jgi:REP element-mobilizing transposase RayT
MARKLRVEFPGAIYHVMNRGDRREEIFRDDQDRARFLETLAEVCAKTGWQVHAFCLMPNHFHLVVETPLANLVAGMKWFLGTYTSRFNRRHKLSGHLFSGRYKSLLVGGQGGYLRTVCEYVHLNPVRASLLAEEESLRRYPWTSFPEYLKAPSQRRAWLRVDRVLGECGIPKDSPAGRREFERVVEARRGEDSGETFAGIRRGWCLGDEAFRQELLERVSAKAGPQHYGEELAELAQATAERIVAEELKKRRWRQEDLTTQSKGDEAKVAIAGRLRRETTMTLAWIAARLRMGTRTHLAHLLYWAGRGECK